MMKEKNNARIAGKSRDAKTEDTAIGALKRKSAVMRTQLWRMKIKLKQSEKSDFEGLKSPYSSKSSEYRAAKKVRQSLPKTPKKRAHLVKKMASSPRVSQILNTTGETEIGTKTNTVVKKQLEMSQAVLDDVSQCLEETKPKGGQHKAEKKAYETLKHAILRSVSRRYRIKRNLLSNMHLNRRAKLDKCRKIWWEQKERKRRKDSLKDSVKQDVTNFFLSEEISREVPNKREVVTIKENDKKERVSKHVMIMTMRDAFENFKRKYKDVKIGFTPFCKLKPKQVRKVSETSKRSCLCQICCNAALKEEAMKTLISSSDELKQLSEGLKIHKKDVSAMTLCSFNGTENKPPKSECLNRKCKDCGVHIISDHYKDVAKVCRDQKKEINWYSWEYVDISKGETKKRIMSRVSKTTSVDQFLIEYENTMSIYSSHKFRASWQHDDSLPGKPKGRSGYDGHGLCRKL